MFSRLNWLLGFVLIIYFGLFSPALAEEKGIEAYIGGDYKAAYRELRPVAEEGDANAQNILGIMYSKGQGVLQNYSEAFKWFLLSAQQGNAAAQYNLGEMYADGTGVSQNYEETVRWYFLAADQGLAIAQNLLGVMYAKGQGAHQDYVQALMWFNLAAASGHKGAITNRDKAMDIMTPDKIEEALNFEKEWVEGHK